MNNHVKSVHKEGKEFKCSLCERSFSLKANLLRHTEALHIKEKNHECKYCKKKFSVKDNCSRHMKKIHEKTQQEEKLQNSKMEENRKPRSTQ